MKEEAQLSIIIVLSIIIAAIAIASTNYFEYGGKVVIDEYKANFYPEGYLYEDYKYDVKGQYTMLYRVWDIPLVYNDSYFKTWMAMFIFQIQIIQMMFMKKPIIMRLAVTIQTTLKKDCMI